ncbi:MAG: hypothetical protein V1647_03145 [Pseudomonadota bacterium]
MHLFSTLPGELISMFRGFGVSADAVGGRAYVIGAYPRSILLKEDCSDIELCVTGDHEKMVSHFIKHYHPVAMGKNKKTKIEGRYILIDSPYNEGDFVRIARSRKDEAGGIGDINTEIFSRGLTLDALAIAVNAANFGDVIDIGGATDDIKAGTVRILKRSSFEADPALIFKSLYYKARYRFSFETVTEMMWNEAVKKGVYKTLSDKEIDAEIKRIKNEKYGKEVLRGTSWKKQ